MTEPNTEPKSKAILRCSFCNKSQRDVKKLIAGPTVYICDECVDICVSIVSEDRLEEQRVAASLPTSVIEAANKVAPGHEDPKRVLAAALAQYVLRIADDADQSDMSAVFIAGPTGAGKIQILLAMASAAGLPLATVAAPLLFSDSPFKPKLAFRSSEQKAGVVVVSQIDAIAMRGNKAEECRRVQQSLISIFDGAWIQLTGDVKPSPSSTNTARILFIAVGAFPDVPNERLGPEELIRYGYLPEFAARFGTFITLQPLTEKDIREMLTRENGLIADCAQRFERHGMRVTFDAPAANEIVRLAVQRKAGIRSVKALMDRIGIALASEPAHKPDEEFRVDAAYIRRNLS